MGFHSPAFFAYVAVVLVVFNLAPAHGRLVTLLLASYAYYASLYPPHALVLLGVTLIAYIGGRVLSRVHRSYVAVLYIAAAIFPLLVFKYFPFGADLMQSFGVLNETPVHQWVIPTGVSFFTFQAVSHLLDARRGRTNPDVGALPFALYLAHFPNLLAGPIERSKRLLPQLTALRPTRSPNLYAGARLILWGMFCKRVVADNLAGIVDVIVAEPEVQSGVSLAAAFAVYSFQIYFDFLGYTAIAVGLARCFNVRLHRNFRRPYAAHSLREFWRRWHITLSTWFRDYVFIPLGGSRVGEPRRSTQLVGVFVLSGLWHGAAGHYLAWGAVHGLAYAAEDRLRRWRGAVLHRPPFQRIVRRLFSTAATFTIVTLAWVFFRMPTASEALMVLNRIALLQPGASYETLSPTLYRVDSLWFLFILFVAMGIDGLRGSRRGLNRLPLTRKEVALELAAVNWLGLTVILFGDLGARDFLYFRF